MSETYQLGDRLALHVSGEVTEVHETYVKLDNGWVVEHGDPEWYKIETLLVPGTLVRAKGWLDGPTYVVQSVSVEDGDVTYVIAIGPILTTVSSHEIEKVP